MSEERVVGVKLVLLQKKLVREQQEVKVRIDDERITTEHEKWNIHSCFL